MLIWGWGRRTLSAANAGGRVAPIPPDTIWGSCVQQAGAAGDDVTVILIDPFADEQEETAWVLKASLG